MRQLIAFAKKELKENWRTGKIITLSALTVIFGIMNPLLAKLTPYLVQAMSTTLAESGISVQKITVDATTSWTQFYKNIPMLLIFFLLLFSGILTSEYQNGTIINLLTKGMKRWKIFLSKWIMGILFWSVSYWCCYSITLAYTIYYWDQSIITHPLFPTISQVKGARKIARKRKRQNQGTPNKAPFVKNFRSGQRSGIL
ncbi:ABC transporter permease subunit [Enterococcus lactis]|uniref:ABC transporter permease subunit n=1 Tax=Enterococcus lactis TaxID=357441 RepID=UPI002891A4AF|nr:ABC transporter permease subunit [Enterococcus lactis]MDT2791564.1 ABC transporter permease subunit [Enterococcus lactis]